MGLEDIEDMHGVLVRDSSSFSADTQGRDNAFKIIGQAGKGEPVSKCLVGVVPDLPKRYTWGVNR
jgi:hypothetical protein